MSVRERQNTHTRGLSHEDFPLVKPNFYHVRVKKRYKQLLLEGDLSPPAYTSPCLSTLPALGPSPRLQSLPFKLSGKRE